MASRNADEMFSIYWTKESSGQRFYLNFLSDSRQDGPMRLPDTLIEHISNGSTFLDLIAGALFNEEMMLAISRSLDALYGNGMPRIYVAESGEHLVMNVYIYQGHSRILTRLPRSPLMGQVNYLFFRIIHRRIQDVLENPDLGPLYPLPRIELNRRCMPTGRKAKQEEVCSLIMGPLSDPRDIQLRSIPTKSINVGDPLIYCGHTFASLGRSLYYNIKADNQKGSIKLPADMLGLARLSRLEARRASEQTPGNVFKMELVWSCLDELHENGPPVVYFAENSDDLVINVPLYLEHAPLLYKCLLGCYKANLFGTIVDYYKQYFSREVQQVDDLVYRELTMPGLFGTNTCQPTGRKATREELYSLIFEKKNANPSESPLTPEIVDEICNLIMSNMNCE